MVQLYDQHWARVHAVAAARAKAGGDGEDGMGENEALFYKEQASLGYGRVGGGWVGGCR